MIDYLCSNGREVRFTIRAVSADEALSRAITQFSINGQYYAPILASSTIDPNDYKSSTTLDAELRYTAYEKEVQKALDALPH